MYCILDIETAAGNLDCVPSLKDFPYPKNYIDPEKIKKVQEQKREEVIKNAPIDPFLGRVVAIGFLYFEKNKKKTEVLMRKKEKTLLKVFDGKFTEWVKRHSTGTGLTCRSCCSGTCLTGCLRGIWITSDNPLIYLNRILICTSS